ncbi:MAG: macro domain-containing protein [Desulfitobacterium hafniense]|nr:macro domain-containing protein [Desulfitobacterium hafniense]
MIEYVKGNLLEADAEALVNTVNCVGVMGKGIALQFKQAFPQNFQQYEKACKAEHVQPGKMFVVETNSFINPKFIINFPTKRHWKGKSKIEDIDSGLNALVEVVKRLDIKSIAIPPLGCGNGGLDWKLVRPRIEAAFKELHSIRVFVYEPVGSPSPEKIKIGTERPHLTKARALFISLMDQYSIPGYRLTLLEVQKLAYFLQVVGEPLRLNFSKGLYGPYADNLNHVLQRLEGHFIRGYGDGTRGKDVQVFLLPNAAREARDFLIGEIDSLYRLQKVSQIIEGFETPYGMELLSTVHWVVKQNPDEENNPDSVVRLVHDWNVRKRQLFKKEHIRLAWAHLKELDTFSL